jgi:dipeptidyl aminopeptidase/acylaminoacyl peptidase
VPFFPVRSAEDVVNQPAIVFQDEGHDITRLSNKVRCYQRIAEFLAEHLGPV